MAGNPSSGGPAGATSSQRQVGGLSEQSMTELNELLRVAARPAWNAALSVKLAHGFGWGTTEISGLLGILESHVRGALDLYDSGGVSALRDFRG